MKCPLGPRVRRTPFFPPALYRGVGSYFIGHAPPDTCLSSSSPNSISPLLPVLVSPSAGEIFVSSLELFAHNSTPYRRSHEFTTPKDRIHAPILRKAAGDKPSGCCYRFALRDAVT